MDSCRSAGPALPSGVRGAGPAEHRCHANADPPISIAVLSLANRSPPQRDRIIESMALRPRLVLIVTAIAAFIVFAVVQDRVTAAGARRYVALQRDAIAGRGPAVTVDEIMRPAVERSVQQGLMWGGAVLVAGASVAGVVSRRHRP